MEGICMGRVAWPMLVHQQTLRHRLCQALGRANSETQASGPEKFHEHMEDF